MNVIMNISDWIVVLNYGAKIAEGNSTDIQNNDVVIEAYLGRDKKDGYVKN
jgi:branched-chain amino acid transport system ATP-binding protein